MLKQLRYYVEEFAQLLKAQFAEKDSGDKVEFLEGVIDETYS